MSTSNPLTPPVWTSTITGRSPDIHGIYDFLHPEASSANVFLNSMILGIFAAKHYGVSPTVKVSG